MTPEEALKQAKEALDRAIDEKRKNQANLKALGPAIVDMLQPTLDDIVATGRLTKNEIIKVLKTALSEMKVDLDHQAQEEIKKDIIDAISKITMQVNPQVNIPDVHVPEIKLPTINVPEPRVIVNVPEIKLPEIKIPPVEVRYPDEASFSLKGVNWKKPLPVILTDNKGNPYIAGSFGGGGGGRGNIIISDILTNAGRSVMDEANDAIKVTSSGFVFSQVSGAADSTNVIQLGGQDIALNSGVTNAGTQRVVHVTDVATSVNVVAQDITLAIRQVSGANHSIEIASQPFTLDVKQVSGSLDSVVAWTIPDATATYAPSNSDSAAYVTTQTVKASAGVCYSLTGYNSSTSAVFIQIHNAASQPAESAAPLVLFTVPASSNFSWEPGNKFGKFFSAGIIVMGSDTGPTKTKISDASLWFNISYS